MDRRQGGPESRSEIILIGPIRAGKTTVARLLGKALGVPNCSLDEVCWQYYRESGFRSDDPGCLGPEGMIASRYHLHAMKRCLEDYHDCVIDFGAGHSYFAESDDLERARQLLAPFSSVFLLLPAADLDFSYRVLQERNHDNPWLNGFIAQHGRDPNERFLRHTSNFRLAKQLVYTDGKTPEETCQQILARLPPLALPRRAL